MKKIIHIDMDCYYAAVEMRDNPTLKDKPIAVGWDGPRSVLCTCNYAARAFGVRSAMPAVKAKQLCPDLLIINGRMDVYKQISEQIREIFLRYTNLIEPLSLDEAYLDVTDCTLFNGSATLIAQDIRDTIYRELQLTASAGIAPVKFIAKVASDLNKPNGQCTIAPNEVDEFVRTLPLKKIPGVGKVTSEKLANLGFNTCGDIRGAEQSELINRFGKYGVVLWQRSHGIDQREVQVSRTRKSFGVERTFAEDISNLEEMNQIITEKLLPELKRRAAKYLDARTMNKLGVKVKFLDFQQTAKECACSDINQALVEQLLIEAVGRGNGKAVRLLGVHIGLESDAVNDLQLGWQF
ncbi:DNA polymerase IV [Colwellia sp. MEBiC06753]